MSVSRCCCCLDLRTGARLVAAAEVLACLATATLVIAYRDEIVDELEVVTLVLILAFLALDLVVAVFVGIGAMMNKKGLMLPWLLLRLFTIFSTLVLAIILIVVYPGGLALVCMAFIILNSILLYYFYVVYSLYLDIAYEERKANFSSIKKGGAKT